MWDFGDWAWCCCRRSWGDILVILIGGDTYKIIQILKLSPFKYFFLRLYRISWRRLIIYLMDVTLRNVLWIIVFFLLVIVLSVLLDWRVRGRRGCDRMVVGFPSTCAISAYHHKFFEFEPHWGEVYSIQHYVIKLTCDTTNKTDHHDITEILLKVALNTIILNLIYGSWLILWHRQTFLFSSVGWVEIGIMCQNGTMSIHLLYCFNELALRKI